MIKEWLKIILISLPLRKYLGRLARPCRTDYTLPDAADHTYSKKIACQRDTSQIETRTP